MITDMNTRLKQFIAAENISQSQFADTIKVVRASVSHVLSGRNNPGYDFIKAIMLAYPNLNMEWLMLGKGKMYKDQVNEQQKPVHASLPAPTEGSLFYEDDMYPTEEEFMPSPEPESAADIETLLENRIPEQTFTPNRKAEHTVNQRKVSKVIIFFNDGSYQEMQ